MVGNRFHVNWASCLLSASLLILYDDKGLRSKELKYEFSRKFHKPYTEIS
ncbi:hypothetical protein M758_11G010800 [Ceratodon purpureus]|uniref:Uncharacterized protein n=1 Tax=Ceratodon purpureus TaxID=3225 RepID=A0A8T0GA15_CERPU|nr:hypothetical protein KC19_11G012000 [Ceratodon purpureus]KAG0600148.1 hypothetical protein M758_11G010800 [Ceratodon purpureus]